MARTETPGLVQARESFVALIDGVERVARAGDIYPANHMLVKRHAQMFAQLGELPDTPRFLPAA